MPGIEKSGAGQFFVNVDKVTDYIPGVSTVTNLVDLLGKGVLGNVPVDASREIYASHLQEKSTLRCVILLVPVLGNVVIGIYDLVKKVATEHGKSELLKRFDDVHEKDVQRLTGDQVKFLLNRADKKPFPITTETWGAITKWSDDLSFVKVYHKIDPKAGKVYLERKLFEDEVKREHPEILDEDGDVTDTVKFDKLTKDAIAEFIFFEAHEPINFLVKAEWIADPTSPFYNFPNRPPIEVQKQILKERFPSVAEKLTSFSPEQIDVLSKIYAAPQEKQQSAYNNSRETQHLIGVPINPSDVRSAFVFVNNPKTPWSDPLFLEVLKEMFSDVNVK